MKYTKILYCIVFQLFLLNLPTSPKQEKQPIEWITIFVHGIVSIQHQITLANIIMLMRDDIVGSMYARTVELIRKDPYFYQHHAMQNLGLEKVIMEDGRRGSGATALAYTYQFNERIATGKNPPTLYYTFGWSGLLSPRMRYLEAELFLQQLRKEVERLSSLGIHSKVRIVAYSNGGNIALELGRVAQQINYTQQLVDELILIGVPVIHSTDYLVASPIFKKVWHLYSPGDRVQSLDTFSSETMFSQKVFKDRLTFVVPDKVTQVEIQVKRPVMHWFHRIFCEKRRDLIPCLQFRYNTLRKANPGHSELWSFGWSNTHNQPKSPFRPVPTAAFIPWIIHAVQTTLPNTDHAVTDLQTHREQLVIKDKCTKACFTLPFLTLEQLDELKDLANSFEPLDYTTARHKARVFKHLETAHREHREHKFRHKHLCLA